MKHMHILVPDELYESLREKAFHAKTSISKVVVENLTTELPVAKFDVPEFIKKEPLVKQETSATKAQLEKEVHSSSLSHPRNQMNPTDYF